MPAYHVLEMGPTTGLLLNLGLLGLICWSLLRIENNISHGQKFLILGLCAIFGIAGRILLSPIPNVQPVTVIVLLAGIRMGAKESVFIATIIALCSNLVLGHGIWTLYQAVAWSLIGILGAIYSSKIDTLSKLIYFSAFSGLFFNWFVSISILHGVSFELLLPYIISGLPFDLLHIVGNVTFVIWFSTPLSEIMSKHNSKITLLGDIENEPTIY